jgi:hypothetical protein
MSEEYSLGKQLNCLFNHCNTEIQLMTAMLIKQMPEKSKIMKKFNEKRLNKEEYIKQMINLEKKLYISTNFKKQGKCALKNCGDLMKFKLDNILMKLDKVKMIKPVYSVNDYTKIHWMERKNMMETEFKEKLK